MSKRERHAVRLEAENVCAANSGEIESKGVGLTCPCCGQLIHPKLFDYLPSSGSFKQYRCIQCASWLTIDLRSRIKLIVAGIASTISLLALWNALSSAMGTPLDTRGGWSILPFAFLMGGGIWYALALYMQRTAKWVPATDQ